MAEEDILFGKKRHLFGGIEPSNMKKFEVSLRDGKVVVDAQLPDDTVVNGQTLCTVAGAIIRRKTTGYPKDEFDGDEIANIFEDTMVADESGYTEGDTTEYYYAAFPYTTQGVYNRNEANRASFNVPVFEITRCECVDNTYDTESDPIVRIWVKVPPGVDSVKVGRSTINYDDAMQRGALRGVVGDDEELYYPDTDIEHGKTYYYTFGLQTSKYPLARVSVYVKPYNYLYGFDLDTNDENPETRVSYPDDVMNANYKPMFMDYNNNKFEYGDWNLKPGEHFMPKPCMITYDGKVEHYLDPNNYKLQEDGLTPSRVNDPEFPGNAMMEWPRIYTKRWEENGVYHFRCSDKRLGPDWDCWCNYTDDYTTDDNFYTAIYPAACYELDSSVKYGQRLRSLSGTTIKTGEFATDYRSYARYKNNGSYVYDSGWDVTLLADHLLLQDLLVMVSKSTNTQESFGNGIVNGSSIDKTGALDDKGMFWGWNNNKQGVKVFGMENLWGAIKHLIAGWTTVSGKHRIKITRGRHDGIGNAGDTASQKWDRFGYNTHSTNISVNGGTVISGSSGGYISEMVTLPYGRMPIAANGTATTYECDTIDWSTSTTAQVYYVGGYKSANSTIAIFSSGIFAAWNASYNTGNSGTCAFLSFKRPK